MILQQESRWCTAACLIAAGGNSLWTAAVEPGSDCMRHIFSHKEWDQILTSSFASQPCYKAAMFIVGLLVRVFLCSQRRLCPLNGSSHISITEGCMVNTSVQHGKMWKGSEHNQPASGHYDCSLWENTLGLEEQVNICKWRPKDLRNQEITVRNSCHAIISL